MKHAQEVHYFGLIDDCFVENEAAVEKFLHENPDLVSTVREAAGKVKEYLPEADIVLRVLDDPEEVDYEELACQILAGAPHDEAEEKYDKLRMDWWLDILPTVSGRFTLYLELV